MKLVYVLIGAILLGAFIFATNFKIPDFAKVYLVNPPVPEIINNIYNVNASSIAHNDLLGLQGGAGNEKYHLNATEYSAYAPSVWNAHVGSTANPHQVTKAQIGLDNVENTALSTWTGSANLNTLGTLTNLAVNGGSGNPLVHLTNNNTGDTLWMEVLGNSKGVHIKTQSSEGWALKVDGHGNRTSNRPLISIYDNSSTLHSGVNPMVALTHDNANSNARMVWLRRLQGNGRGLVITQATTGDAIFIEQTGDGIAINIDSESVSTNAITLAAKYGIQVTQDISGGRGIYIYRNMNEGGANPLLDINEDHTASTQPASRIQYDGDAGPTSGAFHIITTSSNNDNAIYHSSGAKLTNAGVWTNAPSYSWMKDRVSSPSVLDKFRNLDIGAWKWKNQTICKSPYTTEINGTRFENLVCINNLESDDKTHYGAYLDDMSKAFDLDDTGVNTQDWVGINQMAIKEIIAKLDQMEKKLTAICRMHPEIAECRG